MLFYAYLSSSFYQLPSGLISIFKAFLTLFRLISKRCCITNLNEEHDVLLFWATPIVNSHFRHQPSTRGSTEYSSRKKARFAQLSYDIYGFDVNITD